MQGTNKNNKFCDYFSEVGRKYAANIPPAVKHFKEHMCHNKHNSFFMFPTDSIEVSRLLRSMKSKTSTGHDGFSSKLIKQLAPSISYPISIIINRSFETGIVPISMKIAKIVPIYKAKDKTDMGNYRPISLLPTVSKILEKAVHHRLYSYCKAENILYADQYGFQPQRSTIDAIAKFTSNVALLTENKDTTMAVFLDLSKAFDTIDHNILLDKLNYYGIRGLALEWFRNYLSDRTQFVSYKGNNSGFQNVTCGVPQGSVLGPLLFILYTNDLPNVLKHSKCILFADDTTIFQTSHNLTYLRECIEYDMECLSDWFRANKLSLNVQKTQFVVFSPPNTTQRNMISIKIGTENIQRVSHGKFLGIIIDETLNWGPHIDYVAKKIASGSYAINTVKKYLSVRNLKSLYYSFVHSYISYGAMIWSSATKHRLQKNT